MMPDNPVLKSLFPFLHGRKQDAGLLDLALLESVRQKAEDSVATKRGFFEQNGQAGG